MSKILISGYYGFSNAGDEAMLTAIVTSLQQAGKKPEITVLSGHPEETAAKHHVKAIHRFAFWQIIQAMANTDLLLSGGGSLLQDVTSSRSLYYYLSILLLAKFFCKKIMLFAQGIGPIRSSFARKITKYVCSKANLITVRDDGSLEELKSMGFRDKEVIVTSDAVFSLHPANKEQGRRILTGYGLGEQPIIGFALRKWPGQERFVKEFAKAAEALRDKYRAQIVFLPLQFPADKELSAMVVAEMQDSRDTIILDNKFSTDEYMAIISNVSLLVGMRLHALVFAALANVPFMAVSYDPKVDRFVAGMAGSVIDTIDKITAEEMLRGAEELRQHPTIQAAARIKKLREEAMRNIDRAIGLLP
jgi:polysaccharide pyruvyl transferase CsaB